ncbi:MAG: hypothetical protein WDZ84_09460 [Rhodovibrionaceae bacterium]
MHVFRLPLRLPATLRRFREEQDGVILAEVAIGSMILAALMMAVLDFGLAYVQKLEMLNATRAGTQLALVRHPSLDPSADVEEALTSIGEIRQAVISSASFLTGDPGQDSLQVWLSCTCPDGQAIQCVPPAGMSQPCADTRTYANIKLDLPYSYMVPYPGIGSSVQLVAENSIRLK